MPEGVSRRFAILLRASLGVAVCLTVVGILFPQARVWGFHFLHYYTAPQRVIFFALGGAAFALSLFDFGRKQIYQRIAAWNPFVMLAGLVALCGAMFIFLPSAVPLLGDGQLWVNELYGGASNYATNRAPLTLWSYHQLYHVWRAITGLGAERFFGFAAALAGVAVVLAWMRLARLLKLSPLVALLIGFSTGGIGLFFGYAETYAPMTAVVVWMLVLALHSMRERKPSYVVPFLGLVSIALNYAALVFLPCVVAHVWWLVTRRDLRASTVWLACGGVMLLAMVAYFALGWYRGTDVLLPLVFSSGSANDFVFSLRHLTDFVNTLLFCGGGALIVVVALLFRRRVEWENETLFLALAAVFPLAALIMHNSQLGMARDWDIGSVLLLSLPIIALWLYAQTGQNAHFPRVLYAVLAAWTLLIVAPWIGVQASETKSLARFHNLLRLDPEHSETGWDYLASFYMGREDYNHWGECNAEAAKWSPNPRYHSNLALYFSMNRHFMAARAEARRTWALVIADGKISQWEEDILHVGGLLALGNSYRDRAFLNEAQATYDVASLLDPRRSSPLLAKADLLLTLRHEDQAQTVIDSLRLRGGGLADSARIHYDSLARSPTAGDKQIGISGARILARLRGDSTQTANLNAQALHVSAVDLRMKPKH